MHFVSTATQRPAALLICRAESGGRRRHQRRRLDDRRYPQQLQQGDDDGVVAFDVASITRRAVQRVRTLADEWKSFAVTRTSEGGLVISFKRSTLDAVGIGAVCVILVAAVFKALSMVAKRYGWGNGDHVKLVRRDRSLGGKEVVVATQEPSRSVRTRRSSSSSSNLLDDMTLQSSRTSNRTRNTKQPRRQELPDWWPPAATSASVALRDPQAQTLADTLVQVITEKRIRGLDFEEGDIVQLRTLCKESGAKANFGTGNTRDSLFRAAVNLVLTTCTRHRPPTSSFIYAGEDAASFLSGLAANIQLDASRGALIVNAAVASRTRAGFLQAWACVAQGREAEADEEILNLVCMHLAFPSQPNSPEMEMVGRGLERHLTLDERRTLLEMYERFGASTQSIALEALSLDDLDFSITF